MADITKSPWTSRAHEKRTNSLSPLPPEYIHPELSHSTTDTSSVQHIPSLFLSPQEQHLTSLSVTSLIASIADRRYTSVAVLRAFTHRAAIAHQLLNCCLEFPYRSAIARAQELDEYHATTGRTKGPLHGLPISVKDQVRIIGTETTCGFVANLGKRDEKDSLVVRILQDAGAVMFVKTSLSIGCMWGETVNKSVNLKFWVGDREMLTDLKYYRNDE
jgi:amidase